MGDNKFLSLCKTWVLQVPPLLQKTTEGQQIFVQYLLSKRFRLVPKAWKQPSNRYLNTLYLKTPGSFALWGQTTDGNLYLYGIYTTWAHLGLILVGEKYRRINILETPEAGSQEKYHWARLASRTATEESRCGLSDHDVTEMIWTNTTLQFF